MTYDESIIAFVFGLLATVPGATAFRSREEAFAIQEGIGIVIKPEDVPYELRTAASDNTLANLVMLITIIIRGNVPDNLGDPIRLAIHKKIMADKTLGGRCALLIPHSTKWDFEIADQTAGAIEMRFIARYQMSTSDITAPI